MNRLIIRIANINVGSGDKAKQSAGVQSTQWTDYEI